jgi:hydroxypyruvate reductase
MLVARAAAGRRIAFLAAGSDGIDGNTGAAGAAIDGSTWRAALPGAAAAVARYDTGRLAERLGAVVTIGATGVNLLDLHLLWVDPSSRGRV